MFVLMPDLRILRAALPAFAFAWALALFAAAGVERAALAPAAVAVLAVRLRALAFFAGIKHPSLSNRATR
ncbi:hypothetical protein [Micromonospora endolithica]|nr:hypothetical protein [Micromonospora endolithica]